MDKVSLVISAASLAVGVAALCLNEKGEEQMANRIDSSQFSDRKQLKKAYAKEIKRAAVTEVGYTGTVIVLNEKGEQVRYGLVPLEEEKKNARSWVAMGMCPRKGGDRQAIVCKTKDEARLRALDMKRRCRDPLSVHGYAYMDTTDIDVVKQFRGNGKTYFV